MFPPLEIVADDGPSRHPVADWYSCRVAEGPPHRATYVASPRQKISQIVSRRRGGGMEAAWGCAAVAIVPGHWPEANDTAPWHMQPREIYLC
jgi:hypothetical protein